MEHYNYRIGHGRLNGETVQRVKRALRKHGLEAYVISTHVHGFGDKHWFWTTRKRTEQGRKTVVRTEEALTAEGLIGKPGDALPVTAEAACRACDNLLRG